MSDWKFNWKGETVVAKVMQAAADGINETVAEAVAEAKGNHPGWENRTGTAEGSIRVIDAANGATLVARWGSMGVAYFAALEFWHGHALLSAADATYDTLIDRIRRRIK